MTDQHPLPGPRPDVAREKRREFAQELIENCDNDWGASDDIEKLINHRWAVVTERDNDSWVNGIDTIEEIAGAELSTLVDPEYTVEWIEGIYDLETKTRVHYERNVKVEVNLVGAPEGAEHEGVAKSHSQHF